MVKDMERSSINERYNTIISPSVEMAIGDFNTSAERLTRELTQEIKWLCQEIDELQGDNSSNWERARLLAQDKRALKREVLELKQEIEVLRHYGNKDCTSMADERLKELREKGDD